MTRDPHVAAAATRIVRRALDSGVLADAVDEATVRAAVIEDLVGPLSALDILRARRAIEHDVDCRPTAGPPELEETFGPGELRYRCRTCEAGVVIRPGGAYDVEHPRGAGRAGPNLALTRADVERARAELAALDRQTGERSIAEHLNASRTSVRSALGKPRRR